MKLDERIDRAGLIGAAGIGLCPALVATALATIGLGVLTPLWIWLSAAFLLLGVAGFWLAYRQHGQALPFLLFAIGGILLFAGRYTRYGGTGWEGWELWGPGTVLVVAAFIANIRLPRKARKVPANAGNPGSSDGHST